MFLAAQLWLGWFVFSREPNSQFGMEVQWSDLWMLGFYWMQLLSRGDRHTAEILSGTWPTKSCQKTRGIADKKSWPSGPIIGISSWQGPQVPEFEDICIFPVSMPICYMAPWESPTGFLRFEQDICHSITKALSLSQRVHQQRSWSWAGSSSAWC